MGSFVPHAYGGSALPESYVNAQLLKNHWGKGMCPGVKGFKNL